jgi:hypothetical protein
MVALARDHFRFGIPIPTVTSPPPIGSPLFEKLVDRQLDSLNLNIASTFSGFGATDFKIRDMDEITKFRTRSIAQLTMSEFIAVKTNLAKGELRVLGLVTSSGIIVQTIHQVLARCLTQRSKDEFAIHIYDPNFHDCDNITLEVKLVGREAFVTQVVPVCPSATSATRSAIPGFFVMPYRPVKP